MVTQTQIARRMKMDVSSVNKILNKSPGKFRDTTVKRVLKLAEELGYEFKLGRKFFLRQRVRDLENAIRAYLNGTLSSSKLRDVLDQNQKSP